MKRCVIAAVGIILLFVAAVLPTLGQPIERVVLPSGFLNLSLQQMRGQFKELLLVNPNYFGNLKDSDLQPVYKLMSETYYEELACVGYNPGAELLEATVQIKRPTGYGGSLCTPGTTEFVRFYVDYGGGWEDVGVVAFAVHDIVTAADCAGISEKPLSYVAALQIDAPQEPCTKPLLPNVRAILSWEVEPPASSPYWVPVWGNALERRFQAKPAPLLIGTVFEKLMVEYQIPEDVLLEILPQQSVEELMLSPVPVPLPGPAPEVELLDLTDVGQKVEPERFAFETIQTYMMMPMAEAVYAATVAGFAEIGLDWAEVVQAYFDPPGSTAYEELTCVGLDPNREWLSATIHVKKPYGYSGGLCFPGSTEYVAFWADWNDACTWTYVGTVEIPVHDIASIPAEGLWYAAMLPVNLDPLRQHCATSKVARIRAVLSWSAPPSTTDPAAMPYWGNRLDTHVLVPPGKPIDYADPEPIIGVLGGIPVSRIHSITGLTTPDAEFALTGLKPDAYGRPCPFGGRVVVQGPSYPGAKYRVSVREIDATGGPLSVWAAVTKQMKIWDWTGTTYTIQKADADGYFDYLPFHLNVNNVLAWWDTAGDGLWEVRIEIKGSTKAPDVHRIQLDNTAPTVAVDIPGGGCKDYMQGHLIGGTYTAADAYPGRYTLYTSPYGAPAGALVPTGGTGSVSAGMWSLHTASMTPCGYVLVVWAEDRAIVNSSWVGHERSRSVGFCVKK